MRGGEGGEREGACESMAGARERTECLNDEEFTSQPIHQRSHRVLAPTDETTRIHHRSPPRPGTFPHLIPPPSPPSAAPQISITIHSHFHQFHFHHIFGVRQQKSQTSARNRPLNKQHPADRPRPHHPSKAPRQCVAHADDGMEQDLARQQRACMQMCDCSASAWRCG